jgi:phosphopantetheinyl transferase
MDQAWINFIDSRTGILTLDEWDTLKRQEEYRLAYRLWTRTEAVNL